MYFRKLCEIYPDLLKYVESTILDQVMEKIVCGWTDKVRHLGNATTDRVESVHATLIFWLGVSCSKYYPPFFFFSHPSFSYIKSYHA